MSHGTGNAGSGPDHGPASGTAVRGTRQLHRRGEAGADLAAAARAETTGIPLPAELADDLGHRLDADLSDVRLHTGSASATAAQAIGARAFTVGSHIHLAAEHYDPDSPEGQRLLPMGQLASSLGVAPGTATTMVKTLAESGLVEYEPYTGVALTEAGEKLAALVVRRHRVVELFLVRVMGYRWDEVHDEAEQLEHVVSDHLITRMDEMLGRPEVDPHGDPIPDPEGIVKPQAMQTLLTCPLNTSVTITRVIDQDKLFLRFIESHHLKPGESIEVEDRDSASDSVRVRGRNDQRITIGTRAASKLMVRLTS